MKRMIALTAALALTAATATPAAAWGKNEQQALGAIFGLAILGTILNEASKGNARPAPPPTYRPVPPPGYRPMPPRWEDRITWLPGSCLREVRLNAGKHNVISAQCLRDEGVTARLPQACAFDIRTNWGTQKVYGTACLSDAGFRVSRR